MLEDWCARPGVEESTRLAMYGYESDDGVKQAGDGEEVTAVVADRIARVQS